MLTVQDVHSIGILILAVGAAAIVLGMLVYQDRYEWGIRRYLTESALIYAVYVLVMCGPLGVFLLTI